MTPVGPLSPLSAAPLQRLDAPLSPRTVNPAGTQSANGEGFGQMLDGLVDLVQTKQNEAQTLTRSVLLGETDQVHQSIIAMQESSVAFSLMVEVRNKLVESYQELMRMQV